MTKFLNDSAWLLLEKLKKHVILTKNPNISQKNHKNTKKKIKNYAKFLGFLGALTVKLKPPLPFCNIDNQICIMPFWHCHRLNLSAQNGRTNRSTHCIKSIIHGPRARGPKGLPKLWCQSFKHINNAWPEHWDSKSLTDPNNSLHAQCYIL